MATNFCTLYIVLNHDMLNSNVTLQIEIKIERFFSYYVHCALNVMTRLERNVSRFHVLLYLVAHDGVKGLIDG